MGFSLDISVPAITVFFQGLISFFSPCVLPLIPLYIGYLSGGTGTKGEDGRIYYKRSKVMLHTICFVAGVSFAFFLLGLGFSAMGSFFKDNQLMFARIGGILVIMFGLYQLGLFGTSSVLGKERRLPFHLDVLAMSPVTALIMGFTFSFAWTPCVGPALASVLLMAASAATKTTGFMLIGVYTAGFVLPFLAVGLFTTSLLEFFKSHMNVVKYTVKIGGILMVFMGVLMFTGKMNAVTGYLSRISPQSVESEQPGESAESETKESESAVKETKEAEAETAETAETEKTEIEETEAEELVLPPAIDFTLKDQFGNTHTLSDYKGKTVFLNFWATWCPPCRREMPDIQNIYETYDTEGEDGLIVLGIAAPNMGSEGSEEEITQFLEENGYTYPVVMDTTGEIFSAYGITSFPTTFMIDRDGNVFGYASGQLSQSMMESIIQQTMDGKRQ
ncbi:MAG: cytochrome c biogenesis protein CcdA [Lachnoclostridium edouardi]|uniref:redoxin domain-containing protein n=1 Tax=Lachnoclostridium edouardi TaxID=1926283 RepID=UPI0026DD8AA9|nr:cytochrome c biogenesis protein CcdA [Lachnoclostridium edouardi]MDO4279339.1 cytochrome c biogenesis protein CcdA [Lachnoclostridium edouardi]